MKKLLLVGMNSVHTYRFIALIEGYFDDILLLTNKKNETYRGRVNEMNFSLKDPIAAITTIKKIRERINDFQPDIIHMHQANAAAWLTLNAVRKLPVKSVVSVWGSDILLTPHRGFLYRKMIEQILRHGDYFTADGSYLAEQTKLVSPVSINITIANFGIDPVCSSENDLLDCMRMKEDIIYSNRLHKKIYHIDKIIRAFAGFHKTNKNWKLIISGRGDETDHLMKLAVEVNGSHNIEFTGWIGKEENHALYRRAKIFVSVPESDAISLSMLEAMSAGCIPVLSNHPSKKEWMKSNVNAVLTDELQAADFEQTKGINAVEAAKFNFQLVLENGTREIARKKFIDLYSRILNDK